METKGLSFYEPLMRELVEASQSSVWQKIEPYEFSVQGGLLERLKAGIFKQAVKMVRRLEPKVESKHTIRKDDIDTYISSAEFLFPKLADEFSRQILLKIVSFSLLGDRKVQLPLSLSFAADREKILKCKVEDSDTIPLQFLNFVLQIYDLKSLGYPIRYYAHPLGIFSGYLHEQYAYRNGGVEISVKPGDVVIDGGTCHGDMALYMAHKVGPDGKVFAFEFVDESLAIYEKNMKLNPDLAGRIFLEEKALWDKSDETVEFKYFGPATSVTRKDDDWNTAAVEKIQTISIDDVAKRNNLDRVDFIKLDIEGAEAKVLEGAREVIQRFKPNLAIAAYHKPDDLKLLAQTILAIEPSYKLYLNHYTTVREETVLFAQV